jgi:hypothetical protein
LFEAAMAIKINLVLGNPKPKTYFKIERPYK